MSEKSPKRKRTQDDDTPKKKKRESEDGDTPKKKKKKKSSDDASEMDISEKERTPKKDKKKKKSSADDDAEAENGGKDQHMNILEKCEAQRPFANKIATPMADPKETKSLLKLVHKGAEEKQTFRGVKEVVKAIRKKEKGFCIIAGDISPIDVIAHIPVLCENADIPYMFVPSKEALGYSCFTKRPTSVVIVKPHRGYQKDYDKLIKRASVAAQ